jgi:putative hydrolase of the HAD superfamily
MFEPDNTNAMRPLLLLDLDDTLVERQPVFDAWAADFAASHGLTRDDVVWMREADGGGQTPRESFLSQLKERAALNDSLEDLLVLWLDAFTSRYRIADEVATLLTQARAEGWALGVVTNGDHHVQRSKVQAAGLDRLVDAICVSGSEGIRKPDPRLYALAAERAGSLLSNGWMIGDDPIADIGGAHEAGLQTVWLHRGRDWPADATPPTAQADSVTQAIELVLSVDRL